MIPTRPAPTTTTAAPAPALSPSPTHQADVAVIGGGIVGACVALTLRRTGLSTQLFDPAPTRGGATFGNAGLISVDSCIPVALPGLLSQLPKWLRDADGPLALDASVMATHFGWLWQRLRASRLPRVLAISDALRALHRDALDDYRALLGVEAFAQHIRVHGQWHVQPTAPTPGSADVPAMLRRRHGVLAQEHQGAGLHDRLAGLTPQLQQGTWLPANGHALDPQALAAALLQRFEQAGGLCRAERVQALVRAPSGELRLRTSSGELAFGHVVVAAGLQAATLLRPLGVRLPLVGERGYHVQLPPQDGMPPMPVMFKNQGFVLTPMAMGPRLAGKVALRREHDQPSLGPARAMLAQAQQLWPALRDEGATFWTGERPSTPDSLPVLGRVAGLSNVLLACGHGHFGLVGAPMSARLVAAELLGIQAPIDPAPYALARF